MLFWLDKECVTARDWHAGFWWGHARWMDEEREIFIEVPIVVRQSGFRADLIEIVSAGCAEPAWRARRVWHWGDIEPIWILCSYFVGLIKPSEITF